MTDGAAGVGIYIQRAHITSQPKFQAPAYRSIHKRLLPFGRAACVQEPLVETGRLHPAPTHFAPDLELYKVVRKREVDAQHSEQFDETTRVCERGLLDEDFSQFRFEIGMEFSVNLSADSILNLHSASVLRFEEPQDALRTEIFHLPIETSERPVYTSDFHCSVVPERKNRHHRVQEKNIYVRLDPTVEA